MMRWLALILLTAPLAWAQSSLDPRAAAMLTTLPPYGAAYDYQFFDENDSSGNGRHLSATGTPVFTGRGEVVFEDSDSLSSDPIGGVLTNLSAAVWYKATNASPEASHYIVGQMRFSTNERGWYIGRVPSSQGGDGNSPGFYHNSSGDGSAFSLYILDEINISDNTWHHLAFTLNGKDVRCFFDGVEHTPRVFSAASGDGALATAQVVINGSEDGTLSQSCRVGHVYIYQRTISPSEVYELYLEGPPQ